MPYLFETEENAEGLYTDEPYSGIDQDDPVSKYALIHTETRDLNETYDLVYEWRKVMDEAEFSNYTR